MSRGLGDVYKRQKLMSKYYTRACNFYYGKSSLEMLKKKKALPLHGNKELSFDKIEILSRKKKEK